MLNPAGGNPAGVVLDARGILDADMQRTAAEVGYSETAFLLPRADGEFDIRYFSFCAKGDAISPPFADLEGYFA